MKAAGRALERQYKASGLTVYKLAYRDHQKAYSKSIKEARSQYYSNIIQNSPGNSKTLFSTINHLLKPQVAPLTGATEEQCNNFMTFFRKIIAKIRSSFSVPSSSLVPTADLQSGVSGLLCCFPEITLLETRYRCATRPFDGQLPTMAPHRRTLHESHRETAADVDVKFVFLGQINGLTWKETAEVGAKMSRPETLFFSLETEDVDKHSGEPKPKRVPLPENNTPTPDQRQSSREKTENISRYSGSPEPKGHLPLRNNGLPPVQQTPYFRTAGAGAKGAEKRLTLIACGAGTSKGPLSMASGATGNVVLSGALKMSGRDSSKKCGVLMRGLTEISTRIAGFRVKSTNHYTESRYQAAFDLPDPKE
ncbi:hypothetical protein E1301_Tti020928 [Triplophysa tibetana]|uniref:Uncharacterized protein n=1 Tax=Triplophysa tibetana TaxID=1572043 RepID=A0A5A9N0H7_9TELE|nr:hypothetical protein E1301_Tti020928 [Triplophysa tibetana]